MRLKSVAGLLLLIVLVGCSSVSIVPKPEPGGIVSTIDNSIRINDSGLSVMARIQDVAVGGYDIETAIGSFYLTISNNTGRNVSVDLKNFSLVDTSGKILQPLSPEDVNAIINPAISYFLPYPFVGFYDVVDLEQYRSSSAMASERPYVGSGLSSAEQLFPLKTGLLKTGEQFSGTLFFNIEIIDQKLITLQLDQPSGIKGRNLQFDFPFSIEQ